MAAILAAAINSSSNAQTDNAQICAYSVARKAGQQGCLADGCLYFTLSEEGCLLPYIWNSTVPVPDRVCTLLELDGHEHGVDCGHELVQHDDHWDFVVDGSLHHVGNSCCEEKCSCSLPAGHAFDHGKMSGLRNRKTRAEQGKESTVPAAAHEIVIVTQSPEPGAQLTTKVYAAGICCASEVRVIHDMLDRFPGVSEVDVGVLTKMVTIKHTSAVNDMTLVARLNEAHLEASLEPVRENKGIKAAWVPKWNVLLSALLLLLSLFCYLAGPLDQPKLKNIKWVAAGSIAIGIPPILRKAVSSVRRLRLDINFLMTVAVAGALALQDVIEAAAVVVLFAVADWMENQCTASARDAISAVLALKPESATLSETGAEVAADTVVTGTLLIAKPGEKIAIDGQVVSGWSYVDQSLLTGESSPVKKEEGDEVLGGTLNCGSGSLVFRTTASAGDSAVARMAKLVEEATSKQSPMESLVSRFAAWYTPFVVAACAGVAFIPMIAGVEDKKHWVYLALQILITACPCALVLSTPVTVVASLATAARQGVLIKGGQYLEALAKTKHVSMDKTGTLTNGIFQVVWKGTFNGTSENRLLSLAGSLERHSNHPLAACIVANAAAAGASLDLEVDSVENLPGQGLLAWVGGQRAAIGNQLLLNNVSVDCDVDGFQDLISAWGAKGSSLCFVAYEGKLLGAIAVADAPRLSSKEAMSNLQGMNVQVKMLTGDSAGPAHSIATAIGLSAANVHAALLPEDKLRLVDELRKDGVVVHVGDGINDAPALAAADVGIAMGSSGAAIAVEAGDVTLFTTDLRCLSSIVRLGRAAQQIILFNITISVVTKVAVVVLAALGRFTLWGAVLVDTGAAIVVVLNGMRCLRWDIKTGSIWGFSRVRKGIEDRKDSSLQRHAGDGSGIASNPTGKTCSGCTKSCSTPAAS